MREYLDLIQYGALDLQRSEELFKNEDYNFAAFCAQQALEKYLKGYMLRFGIFETIEQLGHLQYPKIVEKMIIGMKVIMSDSDKEYEKFMKKYVQFFEFILELLEDITNRLDIKIIFWKDSIEIPYNNHEKNISDGIESKIMKHVTEIQKATLEYLSTDPFGIHEVDINQLNEDEKKIYEKLNSIHINLVKATKTIDDGQEESSQAMKKMESLMETIAYGTGKDSLSKDETNKMREFFKTQKSLEWMWTVMESYPHAVIGRYPIEIDGKDPIVLYTKNKENVWEFIQKIKNTCYEIKVICN